MGIPLGKAARGQEERDKGKELGAKKQQDLVGMQVLLHNTPFMLQLQLTPSVPGEPCAGVGTLALCLTGSPRLRWDKCLGLPFQARL